MFRALLDQGNLRQLDLSNLRGCVSGGAPLPLALKYEFEGASGAKLVEGYGLTETAGVVSVNPYEGPGKPGSVGQPLPGTVVRIVDQDDATRAAVPDEPGEIVIAGPQVMQGYHGESASTADFITIDETRYFRTGDLGIIDAAGYVTVVDRINDVIEVGGVKVFPNHIQLVLYANPEVREAMVIGVADQRLGERPKAFITVMTGAEGSPAAFTAYVNARVGKYERLVDVEIRAALPKTAIGKLDRKRLIAEERAKMWAGR